jgi:hypothetical protein
VRLTSRRALRTGQPLITGGQHPRREAHALGRGLRAVGVEPVRIDAERAEGARGVVLARPARARARATVAHSFTRGRRRVSFASQPVPHTSHVTTRPWRAVYERLCGVRALQAVQSSSPAGSDAAPVPPHASHLRPSACPSPATRSLPPQAVQPWNPVALVCCVVMNKSMRPSLILVNTKIDMVAA